MNLRDVTTDFQTMLDRAAGLLASEARPVQMEWNVEASLQRHLVRRGSSGIGTMHPIVWLQDGRRGHEVITGAHVYGLHAHDGELPIVEISPPCRSRLPHFWAVREQDYRRVKGQA